MKNKNSDNIEKMICAIYDNEDLKAKDILNKVIKKKVANKLIHDLDLHK